jgi:hypothetical protein
MQARNFNIEREGGRKWGMDNMMDGSSRKEMQRKKEAKKQTKKDV